MRHKPEIYQELYEKIPELQRHEATPRVMSESGVDALLDELMELNKVTDEAF